MSDKVSFEELVDKRFNTLISLIKELRSEIKDVSLELAHLSFDFSDISNNLHSLYKKDVSKVPNVNDLEAAFEQFSKDD